VNVNDAPGESVSDKKAAGEPVSEARAWGAWSLFTHVTTVPAFTVRAGGSNAKFLMVIELPPPANAGGVVVAEGAGNELHPAAIQEMITSAVHAVQNTRRE
jgi:hypothetical protein